jgi:ketosteroid isomerase-like protein
MRIALCTILMMIVVTGSAQTILSNDREQARLLALENSWNQAVQQKDVKAIDMLMDQDLTYIDYDGTVMNKAQYMESLRTPTLHVEHVVNDLMQVQTYGQSAVVMGVYREKGLKNGKEYLHRERFVDTWIKRNGAWLCVASQSTLILH